MSTAGHFDRSIFTSNDQNNGQQSDIIKLENINTGLADQIDANYDYTSGLVAGGVLQPYPSFLSRQALINGNFDVWQRGMSFSPSASVSVYTADRWVIDAAAATTNYTITRQDGTGVSGSRYCLRYARNNTVSNTNNRVIRQGIETSNAVLFRGKKLTLSFYARCGANYSPASSALATLIQTGTGTDESPGGYTGSTVVANTSAPLTTAWQKYTVTTTNVIANNVNEINVTIFDTPTGVAGANDYFEITQVQVNAGDQALPYQPKSFAEELQACQRYYTKTFPYATTPANGTGMFNGSLTGRSGGTAITDPEIVWFFPIKMRTTPTVTLYNPKSGGTNGQWSDGFSGSSTIARSYYSSEQSTIIDNSDNSVAAGQWWIHASADAEI